MEIWKDIPGFEGHYQASTLGRIRSVTKTVNVKGGKTATKHGKIRKLSKGRKGYLQVTLSIGNVVHSKPVHKLVAITFLENPDNLPCVNHKDENPGNNAVENLEWCTYKYNNDYGSRQQKAGDARINGKCSIPVVQCDLEGNFIAEFPSFAEIRRKLGFDPAKPNACAKHKKNYNTAYGYHWYYKTEWEEMEHVRENDSTCLRKGD